MMKPTTFALAVFSLALHCGCGNDNPRHADSNEIGDQAGNNIVAAYGNNEIRLGMSMEELHKLDHPVEINSNPLRDIFQYKLNGIETRCEDNEVVAVHFYYRDREYQTYQGETQEGIGMKSSIRDVICTYGEPDHVSNIRGQLGVGQPHAQLVDIDYFKKGIFFSFADSHLHRVTVISQGEKLAGLVDEGDTRQFRNIDCDDK